MRESWPPAEVALTPGKRVLFLTKDLELIRRQLYEGLDLNMSDLSVDDLLDDINTDAITPAWVCFDHEPCELFEGSLVRPSQFFLGFCGVAEERFHLRRAKIDGIYSYIDAP